ncbi:MAG: hypothetical protein Q7R35_13600 [Elusimicrobiota bacterium]|nr:hypothetical protein [Elusimicrobiota bacterium]
MNKVAIGLVFLVFGIWGMVSWWWFLLDVLKGVSIVALLVAGLLLVGMGVKDVGAPEAKKPSEKPRRAKTADDMAGA